MTLEQIEKVLISALDDFKLLGKDQQLATWAAMNGTKLLAVAKAADALNRQFIPKQLVNCDPFIEKSIVLDDAITELEKE